MNAIMSQKEIFIEKCHKKYGDFYDYSKVEYKNCKTKVCIICPKHGEFFVTPDNFLNNNRTCSKCKFEERVNLFQIFENKIKEKFGDKYDLSFVEYKNCKEEVCIICKKCGNKFYITPDYFLSSNGCPICKHKIAEEKLYKNKINKFEKYFNDNFNGKLKYITYEEKQHIIHNNFYVHAEQ